MELLGESLRKERERRNLSVKEVEKSIRIKDCFIRAIEEERFESLPSSFYAKKFLGIYAEFLGFHSDDIRKWFLQHQNRLSAVKPPDIPLYLVRRKRRVSRSTFILLAFAIMAAGVLVYFISREFPRQFFSSILTQFGVSSPAGQVWTPQEEGKGVFLTEADKEKTRGPEAPSIKETR